MISFHKDIIIKYNKILNQYFVALVTKHQFIISDIIKIVRFTRLLYKH